MPDFSHPPETDEECLTPPQNDGIAWRVPSLDTGGLVPRPSSPAKSQANGLASFGPRPGSLSPFIGREREIDELLAMLRTGHRLVTIASPGGMGKTRLALEVASRAEAQGVFADGVAFASAEGCANAAELAAEAERAVGYVPISAQPAEAQLANYLSGKTLLLVLDNLEHLTEAAGALIQQLLRAPGVAVLATSRERLNLTIETVYPLAGLPNDPTASDALALFVQAAARARPNRPLTDDERRIAADICDALGGMPLGIVLAASWAETLALDELLADIRDGAGFLQAGFADLAPRHHRLHDLLDATWTRLTAGEQTAMVRLAAFRGSFTRIAAGSAADVPPDTIRALMGRSLVWRDPARGRYALHALLRQYAAAQGSGSDAAERHAAYYESLLVRLGPMLKGREQRDALTAFRDEGENIRAAWDWALANRQFARLDAMLEPMTLAYQLSSQWHVCEGILRDACARLADADAPDAMLGRMLTRWVSTAVTGSSRTTPYPELRRWIERARAIAETVEDTREIAETYAVLGHLTAEMGDIAAAERLLEQAIEIVETVDAPYERGGMLHILGYVKQMRGDVDGLLEWSQRGVTQFRALGDELVLSMSLVNAGSAHMWRGEYEDARACFNEAAAIAKRHRNWWRELIAEQCLGSLAFHTGDIAAVKASAQAVLRMSEHYGYEDGVALATHNQIMALLADGSTIAAWQILSTETLLTPHERAMGLAICELTLGDVSAARVHLREVLDATNEKRWPYPLGAAAGIYVHTGALEAAVESLSMMAHHSVNTRLYAERIPLFANLRAYLEGKLPPAAFAAAWARGKDMPLAEMRARVLAHLDDVPRRQPAEADALSPREREIVGLVASGMSNQAIADHLVVGLSTVKKHLTHIYAKLGVTSRTQALIRAREQGLV